MTMSAAGISVTHGAPQLRGVGPATSKSAELLSVSVAPAALRIAAVVLLRTGVGEPSKKLAPPYPMRSAMRAVSAASQGSDPPLHARPRGLPGRTAITFPAVADMRAVPMASGAGSGEPFAPP